MTLASPSPYQVTIVSTVNAADNVREMSSLLKYAAPAFSVDAYAQFVLDLTAGAATEVNLPWLKTLKMLSYKARAPIDCSLAIVDGVDVYTGVKHTFALHYFDTPLFQHLKLRADVATTVELTVAGLRA